MIEGFDLGHAPLPGRAGEIDPFRGKPIAIVTRDGTGTMANRYGA